MLEDNTDWAAVIAGQTAANDADMACRETLTSALTCLHALLTCSCLAKPDNLPLLMLLLATFTPDRATDTAPAAPAPLDLSRGAWHATLQAPKLTALVGMLEPTFECFLGMMRGAAGSFEQELLLLKLLQAITDWPQLVLQGCGVADVGVLQHLPQMQQQVCSVPQLSCILMKLVWLVGDLRGGSSVSGLVIAMVCRLLCPQCADSLSVQIIADLRRRVADKADEMLQLRWSGGASAPGAAAPPAKAAGGTQAKPAAGTQAKAAGTQAKLAAKGGREAVDDADPMWKSHMPQLAEVLSVAVQCHSRPHDLIATLAAEQLAHVPVSAASCNSRDGRRAGTYAALSPVTFHTWFRCAPAFLCSLRSTTSVSLVAASLPPCRVFQRFRNGTITMHRCTLHQRLLGTDSGMTLPPQLACHPAVASGLASCDRLALGSPLLAGIVSRQYRTCKCLALVSSGPAGSASCHMGNFSCFARQVPLLGVRPVRTRAQQAVDRLSVLSVDAAAAVTGS